MDIKKVYRSAVRAELTVAVEGLRKLVEIEPEPLGPGIRRAIELLEHRLRVVEGEPLVAPPSVRRTSLRADPGP